MATQQETWVVYQMTVRGPLPGARAVCRQSEWNSMEQANPGYHTLIQAGIGTETEAEKLARGTSGDNRNKGIKV